MRVALATAGADYALILNYSFPRPSPHLASLGKSVETLLLAGMKVLVARPRRGRELEDAARVIEGLGATTLIAGDVAVEEHLRYTEDLASPGRGQAAGPPLGHGHAGAG